MRGRTPTAFALVAALAVCLCAAGCGTPARAAAGPRIVTAGTARIAPGRPAAPLPILVAVAFATPEKGLVLGDASYGPAPAGGACPYSTGIYCATAGFVLSTSDGGRRWTRVYAANAGLFSLTAWPGGGAAVWGPDGAASTADGRHWRRVRLPSRGGVEWAAFTSPEDAWAEVQGACISPPVPIGGCQQALFATTDAGAGWTEVARTPGFRPRRRGAVVTGLEFGAPVYLGAGRGWIPDIDGVLATSDDGRIWTQRAEPAGPGTVFDRIGLGGAGARALTDVTSGNHTPFRVTTRVMASHDGGLAWTVVARLPVALAGLIRAPGGSLWAVTEDAHEAGRVGQADPWICPSLFAQCGRTLWESEDGGRAWVRLPASPKRVAAVLGLAPLGGRQAMVLFLGRGGTYGIARATFGPGAPRWRTVYRAAAGAPFPTLGVGFTSSAKGWGVGTPGHPGAVLTTADGGRTWRVTGALPPNTNMEAFAKSGIGWAVLTNGAWVWTGDGGRRWQAAKGPPGLAGPVWSLGGGNLVAIVQRGVAVTRDGGRAWGVTARPANLQGPWAFASTRVGWAVATAPLPPGAVVSPPTDPEDSTPLSLMRTTDGGRSWRRATGLGAGLAWGAGLDLAATGRRDVWIVNLSPDFRWGAIRGPVLLHSTDGTASWSAYALPEAVVGGPVGPQDFGAWGPRGAWMLTPTGLWITADGGALWRRVAP